jgi:hypothetical protein
MTKGADMRKLIAMVVLFCSAISTSAVAAEKSDHLLMLMVKSKDGKTQHGEQMVPAKTCHSVAETFAKAHANKVPFTMTLSSKPKVAGEILAAACITPNGDIHFLTPPITADTPMSVEDLNSFSEFIQQGANKMTKKP